MLTPLWRSSLTTVTSLPAYELAEYCYYRMFTFCVSLTNLPELPEFSSLATGCFKSMFQDCTAITTAPELSAYQLGENCCQNMFSNCTSLTTAPWLRAFILADNCYNEMFLGCSKLTSVTLFIESEINEDFNPLFYLSNWLNGAGTDVQEPQKPILYLFGVFYLYYNDHRDDWTNESLFPANWTVQPYTGN